MNTFRIFPVSSHVVSVAADAPLSGPVQPNPVPRGLRAVALWHALASGATNLGAAPSIHMPGCCLNWTQHRNMRRMLGMPAHVISHSALERQLLVQLGGRLRAARTHRGWTASQVADRAGISRTTLSAVESGAASPAIGTYLKVLGVLGLAGDLALVATGEGAVAPRA